MIEQNVQALLNEISNGNGYGERITLVAATKTRTADEINRAISAGISDIGENKVQEFRDKFDAVQGGNRHFIGHLDQQSQISDRENLFIPLRRPRRTRTGNCKTIDPGRNRFRYSHTNQYRLRGKQRRLSPRKRL